MAVRVILNTNTNTNIKSKVSRLLGLLSKEKLIVAHSLYAYRSSLYAYRSDMQRSFYFISLFPFLSKLAINQEEEGVGGTLLLMVIPILVSVI
jgi:hypothetical protein